jgi:hypothetical protein
MNLLATVMTVLFLLVTGLAFVAAQTATVTHLAG